MAYQFQFEKVLDIRQREKEEASAQYQHSLSTFESAAQKLYTVLKQKEQVEEEQRQALNTGLTIRDIQWQESFMRQLDRSIMEFQQLVGKARMKMNDDQANLLVKNLEVKKIEKMREKDFEGYKDELKRLESSLMDEVSIQQYVNRGSQV